MSNEKPEYTLVPQDGELQPVGKIPTVTPEQVNVLAVIQSVSKVEVLANVEETAAGIIKMKTSYLPIVEKAKRDLSAVETKADLDRVKRTRLDIAKERGDFVDVINAELSVRRELIKNAVKGRDAVEEAFKGIESEIYAIEKPIEDAFKAETARKKSLSDAIAKLKAHAINPLLPAADIETAIDDFRLSFGDADYQESQSIAETIFEAKITEFETIWSAAVTREANERKVKEQEKQAQQRANINVTFPLAEISSYGNRTAADIQARIDWTTKVDMSAFELVLTDAEIAKQSCLNMLNAFLPIAQAREAKEAAQEAADKAVAERLEREKQYQDDWDLAILQYAAWCENEELIDIEFGKILDASIAREDAELADKIKSCSLAEDVDCSMDNRGCTGCDDVATESAIIELINGDAGVAEDVAKIINGVHFDDAEPIEVLSDVNKDDCVAIPVKYLRSLVFAAGQAVDNCGLDEDDDTIAAIEFAESLI